MWKKLNVNGGTYLFNMDSYAGEKKIELFIYDLQDLWHVRLPNDEIINIFKMCNPLIEAEEKALIFEIKSLMFDFNRTDVDRKISVVQNEMKLNMNSFFSGIAITFRVTLHTTSNRTYTSKLVLPLIMIHKNLQKTIDFLIDCLKKKDIEISEYKLNGATFLRKNIETIKFQEDILKDIFNENLKSIPMDSPAEILDESLIYSFNEIIEVTKQRLKSDNRDELADVPEKKLKDDGDKKQDSRCTSVNPSNVQETARCSNNEQMPEVTNVLQDARPIIRKSKPVKKLRNL